MVDGVSLPLAFEDAVPVALSTAGLVLLARGIGARAGREHGRVALTAAIAIGLGGAAKVTWKLIAAGLGTDVTWLDEFLFPLLAIGFVPLAMLLLAIRRDDTATVARRADLTMGAVATSVALAAAVSVPSATRLAMAAAILASITTTVVLVQIARGLGEHRAMGMLAVNLAATLVLGGLARVEAQSLGLQWVEQSVNTISQALFLWAVWLIARGDRSWVGAAGRLPERVEDSNRFAGTPFR